ncbi:helix-turn-helix domain-containing protein [Mycolicibacterium elephantis]|uniref:helix-turn-helix domain-containing protein n=1 Tax=Mycolicibacterium elephantis TaxID=81858 RepID=UPI0012FF4D5A
MWSVPKTAAYLGISEVAVRKAITRRELSAIRIGKLYRIDPADVEAFIQHIAAQSDSSGPGAA